MLFIGTSLGACVFAIQQLHPQHHLARIAFFLVVLGSYALIPVGLILHGSNMEAYPLNNPVWSLFFEFAANGLYATKFGRLDNRKMACVVIVSGIALIACTSLLVTSYEQIGFADAAAFCMGFARVSYSFWAGVLMFRLNSLAVPKFHLAIIGAVLAGLLVNPYGAGKLYSLVVVIGIFPLLVFYAISARVGLQATRLCSWTGDLSYPLYLIHQPIFRASRSLLKARHIHFSSWSVLAAVALLSIAISQMFLVFLDRPIRRWLAPRNRRSTSS